GSKGKVIAEVEVDSARRLCRLIVFRRLDGRYLAHPVHHGTAAHDCAAILRNSLITEVDFVLRSGRGDGVADVDVIPVDRSTEPRRGPRLEHQPDFTGPGFLRFEIRVAYIVLVCRVIRVVQQRIDDSEYGRCAFGEQVGEVRRADVRGFRGANPEVRYGRIGESRLPGSDVTRYAVVRGSGCKIEIETLCQRHHAFEIPLPDFIVTEDRREVARELVLRHILSSGSAGYRLAAAIGAQGHGHRAGPV